MQEMNTNGEVAAAPHETAPLVALMAGEARLECLNKYDAVAGEAAVPSPEETPAKKSWWGGKKNRSTIDEYKSKLETKRKRLSSGFPRRNCCHFIFIFLSVVTVLTCIGMIASKIVPYVVHRERLSIVVKDLKKHSLMQDISKQSMIHLALPCYLMYYCVVIILAEMEFPLVRSMASLQNFITKGFHFTFIAIVSMAQAELNLIEDPTKKKVGDDVMVFDWSQIYEVFIELPAWIMLGLGLLYMVLGVLCMRSVRDRCREDYARRIAEYFEAKDGEEHHELISVFVGSAADAPVTPVKK